MQENHPASPPPRVALALAGGGVMGGMYEVGVLAALEERLNGEGRGFDLYVGCSAGAAVASLMANGVRARDLYRILDEDLDDPLNFRRGAVFSSGPLRGVAARFGRMLWALTRSVLTGPRGSLAELLLSVERDLPAGFFSLSSLERFMRTGFRARGLTNSFAEAPRPLLIPAVDLDRAERVVFGQGRLRHVPISQAVAASSAIPGLFEPYPIGGRDYVDGGVGFTGHADLAAREGIEIVFLIHPLVPALPEGDGATVRSRGLYTVLEQTSRICGQNLLQLGLATLAARFPRTRFFLLEPPRSGTPLFGPTMDFKAGHAALRYGHLSARDWLASTGRPLLDLLLPSCRAA
jgi:hypothetical protein